MRARLKGDLSKLMDKSALVADVVDTWLARGRGRGVNIFGRDAGLDELLLQMFGVQAIDCEAKRRAGDRGALDRAGVSSRPPSQSGSKAPGTVLPKPVAAWTMMRRQLSAHAEVPILCGFVVCQIQKTPHSIGITKCATFDGVSVKLKTSFDGSTPR
jgi:hypothetical protein